MSATRTRPHAPMTATELASRPLYARVLNLRHIRLSGVLCFFYFEGAVALAILLALAELVDWLAVAVLPLSIAVMVKMNDLIAGMGAPKPSRRGSGRRLPERSEPTGMIAGRASVSEDWIDADEIDDPSDAEDGKGAVVSRSRPSRQRNILADPGDAVQRTRQSAMYRYD